MDRLLIEAYISDAKLFERSPQMRQSEARRQLCGRLKMDHEQIEGWALMLERNVSHQMDHLLICSLAKNSFSMTIYCLILKHEPLVHQLVTIEIVRKRTQEIAREVPHQGSNRATRGNPRGTNSDSREETIPSLEVSSSPSLSRIGANKDLICLA